MSTRSVLICFLLLAACGTAPSTLSLTATGSLTTGGMARPFNVSSGWTLESDSVGMSETTYGPNFVSRSGDVPRVDVSFDSTHEPLTLGTSWTTDLKVMFKDGLQYSFRSDPGAVFISRMKDTGLRDDPFEISGTIDGKATAFATGAGEMGSATLKGNFTFHTTCHKNGSAAFFTPSAVLCGSSDADNKGTFTSKATEGDYPIMESNCPEAVKAAFIDGTHYTYSVTQLKIGTAKPLSCRIVGDINDSESPPISAWRLCTGTATVEADGCSWTVDAISNPARRIVVNALATSSCTRSAGRTCQITARDQ